METTSIVLWTALAGLAFFVARWLFNKDEKIEDRRRKMVDIAAELRAEGLEHIPGLLTDYAVGDYSGMTGRVKGWAEFLVNDENRRSFFNGFLKRQLELAMKDEDKRRVVVEAVEQYRAVEDTKKQKLKEELKAELAAESSAATPN